MSTRVTARQLLSLVMAGALAALAAESPLSAADNAGIMVSSAADRGPGSLRQAILDANANPGADTVDFDPNAFSEPQTISLESELPEVTDRLTIDGYIPDRLWRATGVTVSGSGRTRVFRIARGAHLTLRSLTVADSCADAGGGVTNLGDLVVSGVTFRGNQATVLGAAILNLGGTVTVINSTFAENGASAAGAGLANVGGAATVTNCTFSGNSAPDGGALYSDGELLLRNTILANSEGGVDCAAVHLHPASCHNLIEQGSGCGTPVTAAEPRLEAIGRYNGPTMTFPLGGGSPAINLGDNDSALDENGIPLVWDQRGNGDPRFVAGYTDIGAFEHQRFPDLTVDTVDDSELRACTRSGPADCPLRGAIELANASPEPDVIGFDAVVFAGATRLLLQRPLPEIIAPVTLNAGEAGPITVATDDGSQPLWAAPGVELSLTGVSVVSDEMPAPASASSQHPPLRLAPVVRW